MNIDILEQSIKDRSPDLLRYLLLDRTTGDCIRWGTDNYIPRGPEYAPDQFIKPDLITGFNTDVIQPRISKSQEEQLKRTKDKAEVFTASWICNAQINLIDAAWFGHSSPFNEEMEKGWKTNPEKIEFPEGKNWKDYVDARQLEMCCGEAPYITSRYDTVTGEYIPVQDRIGMLDRKLRVVKENTFTRDDWMKWARRAVESIYAFDYQGDNVLLSREAILLSYEEAMEDALGCKPTLVQLKGIASVVAWNIWQMDGLTMTAPYSEADPLYQQMTLFDFMSGAEPKGEPIPCKIYDWRSKVSLEYSSMLQKG